MNYGLLLYLKLARVDVGNVSKKGENIISVSYIFDPKFISQHL